MAGRHICSSCLRGLRRQILEAPSRTRHTQSRPLSSSSIVHQQHNTSQSQRSTASKSPPTTKSAASAVKRGTFPSLSPYVAEVIKNNVPSITEPYIAYGATEALVKECARLADYEIPEEQRSKELLPDEEKGVEIGIGQGWWHEQLGLDASFNNWAQVTFLHMWLLTVRLRTFPAENAPVWHQQLVDHFFYLAEEKMVISHNIVSRSIRNNYLKDLFSMWRGVTLGYDQGLIEGDAILAAALWRNVCNQKEDIDLEKLAQVVSYVRSCLKGLETIEDSDIASAQIVFETPAAEKSLVTTKSRFWTDPIDNAQDKGASGVQSTPDLTSNESSFKSKATKNPPNPGSVAAPERPKKWTKTPQQTIVKAAPDKK